jgi:putative oxidoreductase
MGLIPYNNNGNLAILYCFVFLYIAAAGGGPWSIDALHRERSRQPAAALPRG